MCERVHGLKEPVTFDDIQRCLCAGVCLVIVSETDDIIISFRSFFWPTIC